MSTATTISDRATWCLSINGYADPTRCEDPETGKPRLDHDHYDVALDPSGEVVFRYWPIGTIFRTPDGYTLRVRKYEQRIDDLAAASSAGDDWRATPTVPRYDIWTPDGGATIGYSESEPGLPEGSVVVEYVPEDRPAPGSLFLRPNGETWRLRDYSVDWTTDPYTGDQTRPNWSVSYPAGGHGAADDLPDDARLVWAP